MFVQSQYCSRNTIPLNLVLHNLEYVEIQSVKVIFKSQIHIVIIIASERSNYVTSKNHLLFDKLKFLVQVLSW
jgi:hypothetical protein